LHPRTGVPLQGPKPIMVQLSAHDITVLFLSLGILLGAARLLGELAQRLHQPAILGELVAGVLLGPTVLGSLAPAANAFLFPIQGPSAEALNAIATLAIALFLMVAGIEVDLSTIWRQGRVGAKIGLASIAVPFLIGFILAWAAPTDLGRLPDADPLIFMLFIAIALSISALPVIAKTLMDVDLYRSDLGMVVISAAILNDLTGWVIFAVLLGLMGNAEASGNNIITTITLTLTFSAGMLTLGRWLIHKALPYIQAYTRWPAGELSFAIILALLGAAFTEWIGIHAIFGAFLVGAAVGDSEHLRERTRVTIEHFISAIFAPLFFASIGLHVNFWAHLDGLLVLKVLIVTCACKLAGGYLGARWGRMPKREAWAVGFAMVSVGAMGIIIGLLALQFGIISQRLFVAIVIMAMATSMISGPALRIILHPIRKWHPRDALSSKLFRRDLKFCTRRESIEELVKTACSVAGMDAQSTMAAVWSREQALSTGIGNGIAIPHARIDGLRESLLTVGICDSGIDFDSPDGRPAHIIFLILTPADDPRAQLTMAAEIARLFRKKAMLDRVLNTRTFTDFLALMTTSMES
jgi:Kef-type K+ transport system membrane component KefB/mannitol/fructose-specific phosphotransferase system IIA component (Ntr-type)